MMRWTYLAKPQELVVNSPDCLLNGFFKGPPDAHDLSYTLHTTTEDFADLRKFFEVPTWDFNYDVVEGWLEASAGHFGH